MVDRLASPRFGALGALLCASMVSVLAACGGGAAPPKGEPVASAKPADPPPASTVSEEDDHDEGPETTAVAAPGAASGDAESLETLLKKGESGFPAATEGDGGCTSAVSLVGDSAKDFDDLAKHCGAGTGMKAMTRKVTKKLDAATHPRDVYDFKMLGGFCYRFFAVGAPGLEVFNMQVQRPNGAVLSIAETKEGVAIMDPKAPWCKKHDREFHVVIEAKGKSSGAYTFGIWARPSK